MPLIFLKLNFSLPATPKACLTACIVSREPIRQASKCRFSDVFPLLAMLSLACITFTHARPAHAGELTITGSPEIEVIEDDSDLLLRGWISLSNHGNEAATKVYPSLSLGSWSWKGKAKVELSPGESGEWYLEERIERAALEKTIYGLPSPLNLPPKGLFPLRLTRHYQDLNSYPFSSPELIPVRISLEETSLLGDLGEAKSSLNARLKRDQQKHSRNFLTQISNSSNTSITAQITYHTAEELRILAEPDVVQIPANATIAHPLIIDNLGALPGSTYAVFAIIQWQENGKRQLLTPSTQFRVESQAIPREGQDQLLIVVLGLLLIFSLILFLLILLLRTRYLTRLASNDKKNRGRKFS